MSISPAATPVRARLRRLLPAVVLACSGAALLAAAPTLPTVAAALCPASDCDLLSVNRPLDTVVLWLFPDAQRMLRRH